MKLLKDYLNKGYELPSTVLKYNQIDPYTIEISWSTPTGDILEERHAFAIFLQEAYRDSAVVNEGYYSIAIIFKVVLKNVEQLVTQMSAYWKELDIDKVYNVRTWHIPIYYDLEDSDLSFISEKTSLPIDEVIKIHHRSVYKVQFIGFLPGFPYLSGLDPSLNIERRAVVRPQISAGSVAIAAGQCGIYPRESPGGWYILGKSPLVFFDVHKTPPQLLNVGDTVVFKPVDKMTYQDLMNHPVNSSLPVNE